MTVEKTSLHPETRMEWNSTFLTVSFIIEGASKKVLQLLFQFEPIEQHILDTNAGKQWS
jgi:hypothetical protein